jgi:hypothetical protein
MSDAVRHDAAPFAYEEISCYLMVGKPPGHTDCGAFDGCDSGLTGRESNPCGT